ncbi:hypothetical protein ACQ4M4_05170 [Leptolyngbya sp. AN02str]|uniref:hypothetical protein n=1 Tax=Leptolyngbya sp. AN02str TaxID=3423363 RepID=UPI003D31C7FD
MSWEYLALLNVDYQWQLTPETTSKFFKLTWQPAIGYDVSGRALIGQAWINQNEPEFFGIQTAYGKDEGDLYYLPPPRQYPENRRLAFRFLPAPYWTRLNHVLIEQWTGEDDEPAQNVFNVSVEALPMGDRPSAQLVSNTNETVQPNTNTVLAATNGVQGYGGITGDAQNPSRIVLGASGLYLVGLQINYVANTVGNRAGWIRRNGSILNPNIEIAASASRYLYAQTSLVCNAGDYLELLTFQSASVALSCTWRMYTFKVS